MILNAKNFAQEIAKLKLEIAVTDSFSWLWRALFFMHIVILAYYIDKIWIAIHESGNN